MVKQTRKGRRNEEEQQNCSICTTRAVNCKTVDCSHQFCYRCLSKWLRQRGKCPMCRQAVTKTLYKNKEIINEMELPEPEIDDQFYGDEELRSIAWMFPNRACMQTYMLARLRQQFTNKIFFYPFIPFYPQAL